MAAQRSNVPKLSTSVRVLLSTCGRYEGGRKNVGSQLQLDAGSALQGHNVASGDVRDRLRQPPCSCDSTDHSTPWHLATRNAAAVPSCSTMKSVYQSRAVMPRWLLFVLPVRRPYTVSCRDAAAAAVENEQVCVHRVRWRAREMLAVLRIQAAETAKKRLCAKSSCIGYRKSAVNVPITHRLRPRMARAAQVYGQRHSSRQELGNSR